MAANLQKHLSKESYPPLIVYNRTASRADPLKELGVRVATSVEDAVSKADIVFTCVCTTIALILACKRRSCERDIREDHRSRYQRQNVLRVIDDSP